MEKKPFNAFQKFPAGHFSPAYDFCKEIPPGMYRIEYFDVDGRYALFKEEFEIPEIIDIPSEEILDITRELTGFYDNYDKLKSMGLPRSRGVLLTGQPGLGKSKVIERLALKTIFDYKGIVFDLREDEQLVHYIRFFNSQFRVLMPEAKVFTVLEDCERFSGSPNLMSMLLNMLSGVGSTEHFIVATSNYPEKIDPRLLRVGRFDRRFRLRLPDEKLREFFLKELFKKSGQEPENMKELVGRSEGLSYAEMKELVVSTVIGRNLNDTISILSQMAKHPSAEITGRNKIGF